MYVIDFESYCVDLKWHGKEAKSKRCQMMSDKSSLVLLAKLLWSSSMVIYHAHLQLLDSNMHQIHSGGCTSLFYT